ncbi:hypothetical protein JRQ81_007329 [Phrynocephalus forsythii]|uniref:Membrane magnesium transporter n=1 Tax=Phrynocephalus forsythii TaxID=171643 RepID=A0A9Q1AU52_9SAUR|nr:hypothetical protein JRQ81_007329 [Phrynocephalus forsythii]
MAAAAAAAASLWKGLVGLGLFALAHAAFSAAQHRSYMRLTEKEDETLPIDIVLQTLLAFAVTCYGIVHIAGEFRDMDATSELKYKIMTAGDLLGSLNVDRGGLAHVAQESSRPVHKSKETGQNQLAAHS